MNRIKEVFTFSEEFPLIFTQINFWIFFAIVYFLFAVVYKKRHLRSAYLFLISLFFYYKTSGLFVSILILSTVTDFFLGKAIYNSTSFFIKKILVILSVCINLFILCYFKYAYFFTDSLNHILGSNLEVINYLALWSNQASGFSYFNADVILLPVGISFYTFQTISYSVDIYRQKLKPVNSIIDFGFFVSFFPQLVAGPIVRAASFIPQITKEIVITRDQFNRATYMIMKGLIKKMIFADYIARNFLDRVFDAPELYSGFANIMSMFGYSLQIYGDFSGYTDIAIGLALLMGFTLPVNFNSPYKAINCGDYWKRWHISLSSWLKDYLYIPLGGNRRVGWPSLLLTGLIVLGFLIAFNNDHLTVGILTAIVTLTATAFIFTGVKKHIYTNINVMLTMFLGGLWHGASWKFVVWGSLNGLGILVYKYWRKISPWEHSKTWVTTVWKILITFLFVTFTRIYFRSNSMDHISRFYHQVWNDMQWSQAGVVLWEYRLVFIIMAIGYLTHWLPQGFKDRVLAVYGRSPMVIQGLVVAAVALICYQAYSAEFQAFIYFQF